MISIEAVMVVLAALATVNAATILAFWWDKRRARRGGQRVSEATLLGLAFFGGWPAARWAQRRFRHKTRKEPFRSRLARIPLQWLLIGGVGLAAYVLTSAS